MKTFYTPARIFALGLLVLGLAPQYSLAQTVTYSPTILSFGVPTGTPSPYASASATISVGINGTSGNVTFNSVAVSAATNGTIETATVATGGTGYSVGTTFSIGGGTGGTGTVTSVSLGGVVTAINIDTAGSGYTSSNESTSVITGTGDGNLAIAIISTVTVPTDFMIQGSPSCTGTINAPSTCLVTLQFKSSLAPASTLETATLTVSYTIPDSSPTNFMVPLSGAYGAIRLFNETNVATSVTGANYNNLYTIANAPLNLSCPASPTATLSNTPDGLGYVLVDNYVTLAIGGTAVNGITVGSTNYPAGNVCSGGPADGYNGNSYSDCFSTNYQVPASSGSLTGLDPDTFTNPGNTVLSIQSPNTNNAGGVPPINLTTFFSQGLVQATFTALDAGGWAGNSSLYLFTNCSPAGIVSGGSISGNSTPTNSLTFSSSPGQAVTLVDSTAGNPPASGTYPIATDIAVPQQLFYQLVNSTSAGPAVCFRVSAELDYSVNPPAPMCKAFLIQCYNPSNGTISGPNCDSVTPNAVRNLYDAALFDSPDGPMNGHNYLYGPVGTPAADACSYYLNNLAGSPVKGGACAPLTGPGLLMGGDNWLTLECAAMPCSNPTTSTGRSTVTYSAANCLFSGSLTGDLCPFNTLTVFLGAADPQPGGSTGSKNSLYIPVANMPLPYALAFIENQNNGWVPTPTAQVAFIATPAIYLGGPANPPANNFEPAPLYSVTFGTTPASVALPDTTSPIPSDTILYNNNVNQNLGTENAGSPLCPLSTPTGFFTPTGTTSILSPGIYNLHFFATDCALSEGLIFNPQGSQLTNPTANWASFEYVTFGVDTITPSLSFNPTPPSGGTYTKGSPGPKVYFTCTTLGPSGLQNCGTSLGTNLPATGYPPVGKSAWSSSVTLPTTTTGTKSVTFFARSEAGLEYSSTYTYTVH
ncbi:MAG: hypothetical protein ACLQBK_21995 [Candidatus Sulfotelmatobacter sp.]